ncbi:hypothetical protein [Massilia glaciei]|uniref:Hemagglutinin n=1 Tax=Massilia glaciei TaxID=1524097 RepID=A0A2U2HI32_9BURK|nr:hypothetical protein [Massilia glaciei]PWF46002.1 hypothetical protein C7C56_016925 [Massilia glaciei]
MTTTAILRAPAALLIGTLLASCGGGGGGTTPPPPPPPAGCATRIVADTSVAAGKTASASVLGCASFLSTVTWTQVSGPAVTLQAARSPTVAFEAAAAGTVRLQADARYVDGSNFVSTTDVVVGAAPAGSFVTARADHSVRPGTDTSVRAWPTLAGGATLSAINWTQLEGPNVNMDTSRARVLMFKAPVVNVDTVLKFRATMTTSAGTDTDDISILVERTPAAANNAYFDVAARVHPYRMMGAYAGVLASCTYTNALYYNSSTNTNFCPVSSLPLIQAETVTGGTPTVSQVMNRVLVTHDFLGANFEQFLTTQDTNGDFRRLLAGATAVVIGSHVRPSFYTSATGAIYLDANNLWLIPEQRDVVTEVPDYRSSFDDALNFTSFGRAVKNNNYANASYSSSARVSRDTSALVFSLGRLLYHELAHAGDFFEPSVRNLVQSQPIYLNVADRIGNRTLVSDGLANQYPLTSLQMKGLGQVMFQGTTASATQIAYTATQVGDFFAADRANDDYAYSISGTSNSREDLAMLFEEFMMSYRHGVQYDIAFTNKFVDGMTASQVIVAWGTRGRIGHVNVKPRIKLVLGRLAPWIDQAAVDALPAPLMMRVGENWDQNLVLGAPAAFKAGMLEAGVSAAPIDRSERLREDAARNHH